MPGSAQEIRYINRDENTHLWLFRNMILEMKKELPELFTPEHIEILKEMLKEGVRQPLRKFAISTGMRTRISGCSAI